MNPFLRMAALLLLTWACSAPGDPPPTTTTVPPSTSTSSTSTAPPVEPGGRAPEEYFPLDRVSSIVASLTAALQENAWGGWRDPLYVVEHCGWALEPEADALFPMTALEMRDFADEGGELDRDGALFVVRLPMVNKRCAAEHPEHDPRFCGRSDVQRARLGEFRARLDAHLATARELRDALKDEPGFGTEWNSIKGFCEAQQ